MKRRNQRVKLRNQETGEIAIVKVILADSKQGYMGPQASDEGGDWGDPDNDTSPWWSLEVWEEIT
tara:strand:- start:381 stop:575 length:195 start_codon:yes stop_codon:yes gene_type:complete